MPNERPRLQLSWKPPPRRVLIIAEAAVAVTWCALIVPQDDFRRNPLVVLSAFGISQLLLLPTLFFVWQTAKQRSRRALAMQLWAGTVLSGFLVVVVCFAFMAAVDVSIEAGIASLLFGLFVGGIVAVGYSAVFGPAIWITAIAIERETRHTHERPAHSDGSIPPSSNDVPG